MEAPARALVLDALRSRQHRCHRRAQRRDSAGVRAAAAQRNRPRHRSGLARYREERSSSSRICSPTKNRRFLDQGSNHLAAARYARVTPSTALPITCFRSNSVASAIADRRHIRTPRSIGPEATRARPHQYIEWRAADVFELLPALVREGGVLTPSSSTRGAASNRASESGRNAPTRNQPARVEAFGPGRHSRHLLCSAG